MRHDAISGVPHISEAPCPAGDAPRGLPPDPGTIPNDDGVPSRGFSIGRPLADPSPAPLGRSPIGHGSKEEKKKDGALGRADVWFGVGFNASAMKDAPWAIIIDGHGAVSERVQRPIHLA